MVFLKLVENAMKFRNSDLPLRISISSEKQNNEWLFAVEDNGIGIAQKDRDKIFVIFKRMHNRSDYPGTGIGLAHCKKIVEMHGGKIWVESAATVGSSFKFTIPIVPL